MGTKKTGPCLLEPLLLGWKLSMNDKAKVLVSARGFTFQVLHTKPEEHYSG